MTTSRLPIDPSTHLPSIQTAGELSSFLQSAVADEEAMQVGEGLSTLAAQIESIATGAKASLGRDEMASGLMDLLTLLRAHRALVIGLSPAWRGLYEYASYLNALNNFRVMIGQWLLEGEPDGGFSASFADFDLVAWRTLGEGMLLIDMYDQWREQERKGEVRNESALGELDDSRARKVRHWWDRLRR